MQNSVNIVFLTSGKSRGSNFEAVMQHLSKFDLPIKVPFLIITRDDAPIQYRAEKFGIECIRLKNRDTFEEDLLALLEEYDIDLIVLAGFMRKLSEHFLQSFSGDIINIHPALLPKYGGKGMYGMRVHEKVFLKGDEESGVTVHYVNDDYDAGPIIAQRKIPIGHCSSAEEIAHEVLQIEHILYPEVIEKLARDFLQSHK